MTRAVGESGSTQRPLLSAPRPRPRVLTRRLHIDLLRVCSASIPAL
ncbi:MULTISPECIES: hypothetical protein [unclassified Streptomyces]